MFAAAGAILYGAAMSSDDRLLAIMDPARQDFEIQRWPFYHLARLNSLYSQRMDAALKPLGVDVPRWRVLALLDRNGPSTITQLSREAVSRISTMTKIIQRMTAENTVIVRPSPDDARSTEVVISPEGARILDTVKEKVGRIGRAAFDGTTLEQIEHFNQICQKLYANLAH